jgi:hypothetical protein
MKYYIITDFGYSLTGCKNCKDFFLTRKRHLKTTQMFYIATGWVIHIDEMHILHSPVMIYLN